MREDWGSINPINGYQLFGCRQGQHVHPGALHGRAGQPVQALAQMPGAGRGRTGALAEVVRLAPGPAWPADMPWPAGEHTIPIGQPLPPADVVAADVALIATSLRTGKAYQLARRRDGGFAPAFDLDAWRRQMTAESYRPEHMLPLSARLPFHYHRLPGFVRNATACVLLALARPRAAAFRPSCATTVRCSSRCCSTQRARDPSRR